MLLRSISLLALAVVTSSAPLAAQNAAQGALLAQALDAAAAGDWPDARTLAQETGSPIADDLVLWTRLRDGAGNWDEYGAFLASHPDWPSLAAVRRAGERQMPSGQPPEAVFAFFDGRLPETGTGALRLAEAFSTAGREDEARAEAVRAWTTFSMTPAERKSLVGRWKDALAGHHEERMDMLLWRGQTAEAEAMMGLVSPDWQKLAQARILTRRDAEGLQYAIAQVPPALRDDPGLAYERYLYRIKKARWQEAEDFLLENSRSAEALGRPDLWMERRANLARQALEDGQVEEAYAIAANSFGTSGADYADAEWVAGFIALTRLDDPEKAVGHFRRFQALVATPISLGRAGYWLGLASEAAGDTAGAEAAFAEGARWQTSFYGQLAAERAGLPADPALAGSVALARLARRAGDPLLRRRGRLLPPRRRRRRARLDLLPPGGRRTARRPSAPPSPRWRSTSAAPRSASASARTLPPTASSSPTSTTRSTPLRSATGTSRPNTRWPSPARNPSSTRGQRAAPAPAA